MPADPDPIFDLGLRQLVVDEVWVREARHPDTSLMVLEKRLTGLDASGQVWVFDRATETWSKLSMKKTPVSLGFKVDSQVATKTVKPVVRVPLDTEGRCTQVGCYFCRGSGDWTRCPNVRQAEIVRSEET